MEKMGLRVSAVQEIYTLCLILMASYGSCRPCVEGLFLLFDQASLFPLGQILSTKKRLSLRDSLFQLKYAIGLPLYKS